MTIHMYVATYINYSKLSGGWGVLKFLHIVTYTYLHKQQFCSNTHGVDHCTWARRVKFTHVYSQATRVCMHTH